VKGNNDNTVQSVERAMLILETLSTNKDGAGITSIATETGLHKSTVHRLLSTLMIKGYVEKEMKSDIYRLSAKILALASSVLDRMDIRNISKPYIRLLAEDVNEVVHLSILDGDEAVYIDKEESSKPSSIRMHSQIGKRVPLYCTAVGKVLLSRTKDDLISELLSNKEMIKFMPNTIVTVDEFIKEVIKARIEGYAMDNIEHEEGIRCIAAPVHDRNGSVAAAISISGPIFYITEERLPELKAKILKVSKDISAQLGFM
jgi:DNA-binding IclR family transcriptional regulator